MSRKAEALTHILVDTRIRELKAKTSADTKGIVDHFTFALNRRSRVRIAQEAPKTQGRWLSIYLFC